MPRCFFNGFPPDERGMWVNRAAHMKTKTTDRPWATDLRWSCAYLDYLNADGGYAGELGSWTAEILRLMSGAP